MRYHLIIKPNSRNDSVIFDADTGIYHISTKAKPIEGEANKSIISLMSKELGVPKSLLSLERGEKSKFKTLILNK